MIIAVIAICGASPAKNKRGIFGNQPQQYPQQPENYLSPPYLPPEQNGYQQQSQHQQDDFVPSQLISTGTETIPIENIQVSYENSQSEWNVHHPEPENSIEPQIIDAHIEEQQQQPLYPQQYNHDQQQQQQHVEHIEAHIQEQAAPEQQQYHHPAPEQQHYHHPAPQQQYHQLEHHHHHHHVPQQAPQQHYYVEEHQQQQHHAPPPPPPPPQQIRTIEEYKTVLHKVPKPYDNPVYIDHPVPTPVERPVHVDRPVPVFKQVPQPIAIQLEEKVKVPVVKQVHVPRPYIHKIPVVIQRVIVPYKQKKRSNLNVNNVLSIIKSAGWR